ncbi:MAG: AAA family ATPase, partial [Gammaproteobacteria bacterium]|nr:AAA family ATPase [Gammaproteobacteria bacterium]
MAVTALYSLYRPHTFDEVVGQNYVVFTLVGALKKDSINHAYLFTGPRGSGKTTVARILAASVNCKSDSIACGKCESCLAIQN